MMEPPRLRTQITVQALTRRCHAEGRPAFVLKRGDPDAGALFLKLNGLGQGFVVLAPVRDGTGQPAWLKATGPEPVDESVASAYLERQRRIDPDLWILEIEDASLALPLDAPSCNPIPQGAAVERSPIVNPTPLFLVIEGNTRAAVARMATWGALPFAEQYGRVLQEEWPGSQFVIVRPADGESALPEGLGLRDLDGVVLGGSALNIPTGGPEIDAQIALARAVFEAGVPFFGSCWGLQIAAVAAGGSVRKAPHGREVGVARKITATDAGIRHPLLAGRPTAWDALAVHEDEVDRLPTGAQVLATNGHSAVQAAEIRHAGGVFWGVQYHPEFDLPEVARTLDRLRPFLLAEGLFADEAAALDHGAALRALAETPERQDIAWRLGIDADVLSTPTRRLEIRNWLTHAVTPRLRARS
ncbi:DUF1491 family protein [Pararhodospirillum photometricum]|nr:DUF1491 family protein [Pararhodospirillum photometricum]